MMTELATLVIGQEMPEIEGPVAVLVIALVILFALAWWLRRR
ncbi:MAG: hypothetical protein ACR2N7_06530 [Acidimicrobiia bacterium]